MTATAIRGWPRKAHRHQAAIRIKAPPFPVRQSLLAQGAPSHPAHRGSLGEAIAAARNEAAAARSGPAAQPP